MKKIVDVTQALPRLEQVFRDLRLEKIDNVKKEYSGKDDNYSGAGSLLSAGLKQGGKQLFAFAYDQSYTEEEKDSQWNKIFKFPHHDKVAQSYFTVITDHKKITNTTKSIIDGVEAIKFGFDEDEKYWTKQEYKNFFFLDKNITRMNKQKRV